MRIWLLLFAAVTIANWHDGGLNALSRFAVMQSIAEEHTVRIDHLRSWTEDWAKGPDGHLYSNKAPGPMLLAAPAVWLLDRIKIAALGERAWETYPDGKRGLSKPGVAFTTFISLVFQALPYAWLAAWFAGWLGKRGASLAAINFTLVALLFGNTLSLFLNLYFGHAVAASALLAALLCVATKRHAGAGLFFGLALLSDYGTLFVAPAFFLCVVLLKYEDRARSLKQILGRIALGGALPALVFAAYHASCFGRPWALPMQFQNPRFVETNEAHARFWGVAAAVPDWRIFLKLCFGAQRGILITQPWMWILAAGLATLGIARRLSRDMKAWSVFAFGGLFGLLWMNAGFNGWLAGASAGPRYLCIVFPCICVLGGAVYDELPPRVRALLWLTLAYSVFFRMVVFATTPLADSEDPLWRYLIDYFLHRPHPLFRVAIFASVFAAFAVASVRALQIARRRAGT